MAATAADVLAVSGNSRPQPQQESCEQCGSLEMFPGFEGLSICGDCGAMSSSPSAWTKGGLDANRSDLQTLAASEQNGWGKGNAGHSSTEGNSGIPLTPAMRKYMRRQDEATRQRFARCRAAISVVGNALLLQDSLQDQAHGILVNFTRASGKTALTGMRLKLIVGSCIFAASIRAGVGLTLAEVALRAGNVCINRLQRVLWRICKVCGLRLHRTEKNVDSLAERMCLHFNLVEQRGAVRDATCAIVRLASDCWQMTGRQWGGEIAACFWLAARSFHYVINVKDIASFICTDELGLIKRVNRLRNLFIGILRTLPWGAFARKADVHLYVHSVLDNWEIIHPILPDLKRQALENDPEALDIRRTKNKEENEEDPAEPMSALLAAAYPPDGSATEVVATPSSSSRSPQPASTSAATGAAQLPRKRASKRTIVELGASRPVQAMSKAGLEEGSKKKTRTRTTTTQKQHTRRRKSSSPSSSPSSSSSSEGHRSSLREGLHEAAQWGAGAVGVTD